MVFRRKDRRHTEKTSALDSFWQQQISQIHPVIFDLITRLQQAKGWPQSVIQVPQEVEEDSSWRQSIVAWRVTLPGGTLRLCLNAPLTVGENSGRLIAHYIKLVYEGQPSSDMLLALEELRVALGKAIKTGTEVGLEWEI